MSKKTTKTAARAARTPKTVSAKKRKAAGVGKIPTSPTDGKPLSGLDAAAKVLADAGQPMRARELVDAMINGGLWKSGGRTPWATIYAAVIRDIAAKGKASRFRKTDRGLFAVNA